MDLARTFAANRAAGRIALCVRMRAGVTRRWRVGESGPLRVRCPGPPSAELEAVIVNTAGGVAGGDRHELEVTVGPNSRLTVTTAAAEKVYRTLDRDATIDVKLAVEAGAGLAWLPQETILFDCARLERSIEIDLAEDARLLLAEALVFGRSGMGETVGNGRLLDRWRVRRNGALVHAEATRLDGGIASRLAQPAVAGGGVAVATVLVVPADEDTAVRVRGLARDISRGGRGFRLERARRHPVVRRRWRGAAARPPLRAHVSSRSAAAAAVASLSGTRGFKGRS